MGACSSVGNTTPWEVGLKLTNKIDEIQQMGIEGSHISVFASDGLLQKHILAPACGISSDILHFLEYHLPKISGKIHVLQKVVSFGKTAFM